MTIGKGRIVQAGKDIAILSLGTRLQESLKAASMYKEKYNIDITVADARFAKPIDQEMIYELAATHKFLLTIEEGSIGGFSAHVNNVLLDKDIKVINLFYPDIFMDHATQDEMHDNAGMNADRIFQAIKGN